MDFVLIAFLTLLNGMFAMSEMALASSRKARLAALAEMGDGGAVVALRLLDQPTRFLSTVQVGITSIGVLNGIVGEAAFSADVAAWLTSTGLSLRVSSIAATAIVVACITFVTIIFGELVPKRIGQLYPEAVARRVARPMQWLAQAAAPFVKLLSATTQATLKLMGIDTSQVRGMTEEEIEHSLEEGVDAGVIERQERELVSNVFGLDERVLTSMMVPRDDVRWLEAQLPVADALARLSGDEVHSWYPVCRASLDEVMGVVSVARLLGMKGRSDTTVGSLATPAVYLPETLNGMELLEQFKERGSRMIFVVDEWGIVQGLMTPHDLLEAITGELNPGANTQAWAQEGEDGSWTLDGLMPIAEMKSRLAIDELPDEARGRYNTVAGLVMALMGQVPTVGDTVEWEQWSFEVVALEGRRIDRIVARHISRLA